MSGNCHANRYVLCLFKGLKWLTTHGRWSAGSYDLHAVERGGGVARSDIALKINELNEIQNVSR